MLSRIGLEHFGHLPQPWPTNRADPGWDLVICGVVGQRVTSVPSLAANSLKFHDVTLLRLCSVERLAVHILIK